MLQVDGGPALPPVYDVLPALPIEVAAQVDTEVVDVEDKVDTNLGKAALALQNLFFNTIHSSRELASKYGVSANTLAKWMQGAAEATVQTQAEVVSRVCAYLARMQNITLKPVAFIEHVAYDSTPREVTSAKQHSRHSSPEGEVICRLVRVPHHSAFVEGSSSHPGR